MSCGYAVFAMVMKLTAIFEEWHLGDGNYPPLHKGQMVNLSFEIEPTAIETKDGGTHTEEISRIEGAMYQFCGRVLKVYDDTDNLIVVVRANDFTFYIEWLSKGAPPYAGDLVCGQGRLLLDHYAWVEYLSKYKDPPDLFYKLKVNRIRAVRIPESFIQRHERGYSSPTSLNPDQYPTDAVVDVDDMKSTAIEVGFYIVDFDDDGLKEVHVPRTFRSRS
jgi:hypothetical protein